MSSIACVQSATTKQWLLAAADLLLDELWDARIGGSIDDYTLQRCKRQLLEAFVKDDPFPAMTIVGALITTLSQGSGTVVRGLEQPRKLPDLDCI